jgi:lipoprotein NlpD
MNLRIANLRIVFNPLCAAALLGILLAGCRTLIPAPVLDRTVPPAVCAAAVPGSGVLPARRPGDTRPEFHDVQRGETLYSIALEYGLPYRDLAQWNGLENPAILGAGQRLRLTPPEAGAAPSTGDAGVVVTPLGQADLGGAASETAKPTPPGTPIARYETPVPPSAVMGSLKTEPKAVKLPYSDKALAQLQNATVSSDVKAEAKPSEVKPAPGSTPAPATSGDDDRIDWIRPTKGKVQTAFSDASKGIDIPGRSGQLVFAAAAGKVIHVGSNLRGYGKLVIIQHSSMFLSAYAHNSKILVKEGDRVSKGQKIAEMGNSDTDQMKLHFEIRRFGKPVDPAKYLPSDNA